MIPAGKTFGISIRSDAPNYTMVPKGGSSDLKLISRSWLVSYSEFLVRFISSNGRVLVMTSKTERLLNDIATGNMVLFTGAGVVAGSSIGGDQKTVLLGNRLRDKLQERFYPKEATTTQSLKRVSSNIQSSFGKDALRQALIDLLVPVNPSDALLSIPNIRWRSIYTTNIDDSIEVAYERAKDKTQAMVPVVLPDDRGAKDKEAEVNYFKLHGCLRKVDSDLIFSHRDYTESREKYLKLFASLTTDLCDYPFLFIGFSMEDDDFQDVWESVKKYVGISRNAATYLITPNPAQSFVDAMEIERVDVIDDGAESFFPWVLANLPIRPASIEERVRAGAAPYQELIFRDFNKQLEAELLSKISKCFDFVRQRINATRPNTRFYFGAYPAWEDVNAGLAITRELEQDVFDDIDQWIQTPVYKSSLVLAGAGYGKSTLLMQIASRLARRDTRLDVLFFRPYGELDPVSIAGYAQQIGVPLLLVIDDSFRHVSALNRLKTESEKNHLPIYILGAARPADWNAARSSGEFDTKNQFVLPRLSEAESRELALVMKRSSALSTEKQAFDIAQLAAHFYSKCEQHILAGLLTSTIEGAADFDDIITEEYFRIADEKARELYLAVALTHSLGLATPATLACNVINVPITEYHQRFSEILDTTVIEYTDERSSDLMFQSQHRVIAETLIKRIMKPADAVETLLTFAKSINPHERAQYNILLRIYDEDYLMGLLVHVGTVESCYEQLMEAFPSDPFIKQHYAIFESKQKKFERANSLISTAIEDKGRHPHLLNTQANILLKEAIAEKDRERAEYLFSKGAELLRERIRRDADKEIHILSLVERHLDWARRNDLTDGQKLNALQDAEADLDEGRRRYASSSDIATVGAKLQIQLGQLPNAEKLLERGIKLDASNDRARSLLARILFNQGNPNQARTLALEGLVYSPRSYGLLRIKLDTARVLGLPWHEVRQALVEYIAVAEGDLVENVALLKGLIEAGDMAGAKKQLERLRKIDAPFNLKIKEKATVTKNGEVMVVNGQLAMRGIGHGFVKIDGFPEGVDAYLDIRTTIGARSLQNQQRVKVELGINGRGLFAHRLIN